MSATQLVVGRDERRGARRARFVDIDTPGGQASGELAHPVADHGQLGPAQLLELSGRQIGGRVPAGQGVVPGLAIGQVPETDGLLRGRQVLVAVDAGEPVERRSDHLSGEAQGPVDDRARGHARERFDEARRQRVIGQELIDLRRDQRGDHPWQRDPGGHSPPEVTDHGLDHIGNRRQALEEGIGIARESRCQIGQGVGDPHLRPVDLIDGEHLVRVIADGERAPQPVDRDLASTRPPTSSAASSSPSRAASRSWSARRRRAMPSSLQSVQARRVG